jgi:hypothetical protein
MSSFDRRIVSALRKFWFSLLGVGGSLLEQGKELVHGRAPRTTAV